MHERCHGVHEAFSAITAQMQRLMNRLNLTACTSQWCLKASHWKRHLLLLAKNLCKVWLQVRNLSQLSTRRLESWSGSFHASAYFCQSSSTCKALFSAKLIHWWLSLLGPMRFWQTRWKANMRVWFCIRMAFNLGRDLFAFLPPGPMIIPEQFDIGLKFPKLVVYMNVIKVENKQQTSRECKQNRNFRTKQLGQLCCQPPSVSLEMPPCNLWADHASSLHAQSTPRNHTR